MNQIGKRSQKSCFISLSSPLTVTAEEAGKKLVIRKHGIGSSKRPEMEQMSGLHDGLCVKTGVALPPRPSVLEDNEKADDIPCL